jgi:hypothetical protein
MLINHNINNLSGGVSQQPEESRFDNQVEIMENCQVTVAQGLRRRNPLNFVNTTALNHQDNMITHAYDRGDGLEKYGMILDDNGLRVFDEMGNPKVVNAVGSLPTSSWSNVNWKKDIEFLTVGDTTWILNKKEVTAITSDLTTTYTDKNKFAFYWAKRSFDNGKSGADQEGYDYEVVLNGTKFTTNKTTTLEVISDLKTKIEAAGYTVKSSSSVMRISRSTNFTFASGDSWGNQASVGWRDSVAKIADLPSDMDGFTETDVGVISITGTDRDDFTSYYLKYIDDAWKEAVKSGIEYKIDPNTMPAKVVRQSNGSFSFGFNIINASHEGFEYDSWEDRTVGDDDSSPIPSFINGTISNMFFFKNRLGFTSEENVILSETGAYYNFFATTAMDILDSDPIDAAIDSNTVSIIRNVNATAGAVTMWTDNGQFVLSGGEILSPATTRISQSSSYSCENSLSPVVVDNEIIFFNKKDGHIDILTYSPATLNTDKSTGESISSHVPIYIPSTIASVVEAPGYNMLFLLDGANHNDVYVYSYFIRNNERIISAWYKWVFPIQIRTLNMLSNTLFLLGGTNGIYNMNLQPQDVSLEFQDQISATTRSSYTSNVVLSRFNVQTDQNTQNIRTPFYIKNIVANTEGDVDLTIENLERQTTKTIDKRFLQRRLFIGGNSDKIKIGFTSSYATGFQIDTINLEGNITPKSKNI